MSEIDALVLDLVEWVAARPRRYADVIEAWGTRCPRLPVWEETVERGYVRNGPVEGDRAVVVVTEAGRRLLQERGRLVG